MDGLWQDLPRSADLHSLPVVFATTGRSFNHDQPIIQKFHVSGYARSLRDAKGYYTKVGLEVRERSFGWRQYSLLPYLLLHEILCHAFQSLDNPPIRPDADPSDAWSEGWMDTLAYKLALEWLNKHDKTAFIRPGEYRDAERQIIDLHNARYSDEPCPAGSLPHSRGGSGRPTGGRVPSSPRGTAYALHGGCREAAPGAGCYGRSASTSGQRRIRCT